MKINFIILAIFLSVILLFVLTGCSRQPEKVYITKYKVVTLQPPKPLYRDDITLPTPPSKYVYVKAGPVKRERMLTKYVIDLLAVIKKYKIKLNELDKWYIDMNKKVISTRDK